MHSTMQLFEKAMSVKSAASWAKELNLTRQTFSMAKSKKRLSPALAGNLAIELGEDTEHWIAIAAIEAEKKTPLLERLKKSQAKWRKLLDSHNKRGPRNRAFLRQAAVAWFANAVNGAFHGAWVNIKNPC